MNKNLERFQERTLFYFGTSIGAPLYKILPSHAKIFREVIYICPGKKDGNSFWQKENMKIITLEGWGKGLISKIALTWHLNRISREVKSIMCGIEQPIVHIGLPSIFNLCLLPTLRILTPYIFPIIRGDWRANIDISVPLGKYIGLGQFLDKQLQLQMRKFPLIITAGHRLAQKYDHNLTYVWHGTTHDSIRYRTDRKSRTLAFLGRLDQNKRCIDIIKSVKLLVTGGLRDIRLIIAGDGPQRIALEQYVQKHELANHVEFTGWINDSDELLQLLDNTDIVIMSSLSEGTPKVIPEAMARGCLVIATPVGDVPWMIRDKCNGLIVPPRNPDAIRFAILYLINNPEMRSSIRNEAYNYAREHTITAEVSKMWSWVSENIDTRIA